jgi:hypothetical protein
MSLFNHWVDFVIWPEHPHRIKTMEERMDTSQAETLGSCSYTPDTKAIIQQKTVELNGDKFEAMEITRLGDVTIWTRDRVWLVTTQARGPLEKLINVPRSPPVD